MAILDELVSQIGDLTLRTRIAVEVEKLAKQKKRLILSLTIKSRLQAMISKMIWKIK